MRKILRLAARSGLFLALFFIAARIIPYDTIVGSWLPGKISMDVAIKTSEILLGEIYPEPLDFVYDIACMVINTIVSFFSYTMIFFGIQSGRIKFRS